MQRTEIQYLTHTWNPIAMRCTPITAGCQNCWHLRMANRMAANHILSQTKRLAYNGHSPYLDRTKIDEPLKLLSPARIGVQFMGDLFHDKIPDGWIQEVFDVCELAPQHSFFFLTKRPARMRQAILKWKKENKKTGNMWFGVSVEDQATADERIPYLLNTSWINRWISVEPMLGPMEFRNIELLMSMFNSSPYGWEEWLKRYFYWVVCGAETGPGARPMNWDWAISLADQCKAAGVPFFFKEPWSPLTPDACRRRELPPCDCESCKDCRVKGF